METNGTFLLVEEIFLTFLEVLQYYLDFFILEKLVCNYNVMKQQNYIYILNSVSY